MKKFLLIAAVAGLTVASCSKDRTCTCTTTVQSISSTQPNYAVTIQPPTTSTVKYTKIKNSNIYAEMCKTRNQTNTSNYSSGGTYYVKTEIDQIDCTLK